MTQSQSSLPENQIRAQRSAESSTDELATTRSESVDTAPRREITPQASPGHTTSEHDEVLVRPRPFLSVVDLEETDAWLFGDTTKSKIDGAAVFFVNNGADEASLVYVSHNLAATLGYRVEELLGQPVETLACNPTNNDLQSTLRRVAQKRSPWGESTTGSVASKSGRNLPIHMHFAVIPSMHPDASYVIGLYKDLSHRTSQSGISQEPGILDALSQGFSLGSLAYEVALQVCEDLGPQSHCWVGVAPPNPAKDDRSLEPIITMGSKDVLVNGLFEAMFDTDDKTTARCVAVDDLPKDLQTLANEQSICAFWGFPATGRQGDLAAAVIVGHPNSETPSRAQQKILAELTGLIARSSERTATEPHYTLTTDRALYDPLTRLPNRTLLLDRLEQATARLNRDSSPLAVLMIDIDNFRTINNTYGADLGDEILVEVAARIHKAVRLGDTVGRIGSDQFMLVCVATNGGHDVASLARRISRSIAEVIHLDDGTELFLTASIGVAVVEEKGAEPDDIVSQAESALVAAMQAGRGHYAMFDHEKRRHTTESQNLEQALHKAILNDELIIHYQPVFSLSSGQMVGAEALVRWARPDEGILQPSAFMDLAEESGLVIPMGNWIIDKVAEASAGWPELNGRFPIITINLSARQMTDPSLIETIKRALETHQLAANRLGFEITESAHIDDLDKACETLRSITSLGCRVAIDDFGIGHATLDYLRRFCMASAIKIDRSFTNGLSTSREDTAIVAASIAMAASLGMQVVAEGVETHSQLEELRRMGCHYAQGYLLSRPVAIEVATKVWLTETGS